MNVRVRLRRRPMFGAVRFPGIAGIDLGFLSIVVRRTKGS